MELIKKKGPKVVFLIETKILAYNVLKLKIESWSDYWDCGGLRGKSGGLVIFWSQEVSIKILSKSKGHFDTSVNSMDSP